MEITTSSKYATPESRNFVKIIRLFVDLLRDVLWETLTKRILPEELPEKVRINKQTLETFGRMREDQYKRICRSGGGVLSNVDFDITLLCILLGYLPMEQKKIQPPSKGWRCETYPDKKHLNEGDDIVRIRLRRNFLAHVGQTALSKDAFDQIWADMLAVVKRFDVRLKTTFESEMEVILKDEMSSDLAEDYMKDFENQKQYDSCTREIALEVKRGVSEVNEKVEKSLEEIEIVKSKLAETNRKVDDLTKYVKERKKGKLAETDRKVDDLTKYVKERKKGKLAETDRKVDDLTKYVKERKKDSDKARYSGDYLKIIKYQFLFENTFPSLRGEMILPPPLMTEMPSKHPKRMIFPINRIKVSPLPYLQF